MKKLITLGLLLSLSFAQEDKALIAALDSIEENVIGFALNGQAKGGIAASILNSKALPNEESVSEYSAFTNMLLRISVRPSNETKATFDLFFHKDWQSAYREGNNSPIVRWWSYDGSLLNKKLKFNLGTMRIAYTPLTIYLPEPSLIMEPEIFSDLKKEAMEERYLDGTNRRLLQGINVEYGTPAGMFDNIFLQGTVARLRKVAEGIDRISFDFDPSKDRFTTAARIGAETFGFSFAVSDVYAFNRFSSALKSSAYEIIDYEKNNVLSFELNYNSKKLLSGPVGFGIGAEYALSSWSGWRDTKVPNSDTETKLGFELISIPSVNGLNVYPNYVEAPVPANKLKYERSRIEEGLKNKGAMLGNAFVSYSQNPFEAKLSGHFLNTDKDFEAELAASPAYLPNLPILNSDAALEANLEQFRTGSLENMYYSLYYTLPLNAATIVSGQQGNVASFACIKNSDEPRRTPAVSASNPISLYEVSCLDNNYKLAHYYRNAYTQQTYTRLERRNLLIDPSVNLALPYGYATPDRSGGDADLNFTWNKAVNVRGVFGTYSSDGADYKRFGGGVEVDVARLAGLGNALIISGSYEQNKEEKGLYNPQTDRIIAGAKIGIWRGISLLGGLQQLTKEFKNPYELYNDEAGGYLAVSKTSEILAIGGPQIKISEKANLNLQGGLLSNSIDFILNDANEKMDLDKYIISGTVTVGF
jgi:hypothetical protein